MTRCCADCAFWDGGPSKAFALCVVGRLPGLVPSYCETAQFCRSFTARTGAAQAEPPALSQQSQARGYALPLYRQYVPRGKP